MSCIAYCEACSMQANGVKTRIALEHTCGLSVGEISQEIKRQRDAKNGCQACHFEKNNTKKSRNSHTCGLK